MFRTNPDSVTTPNSGSFSNAPNQPISGVINYLNQFGRTGTFGQYKRRDPVGELYYESLRYLQGLPPTLVGTSTATNAIYGIDGSLRDGFPVVYADYPAYTDPHPASHRHHRLLLFQEQHRWHRGRKRQRRQVSAG